MEFPFKFGSIDPYMQTLSVKKHEQMLSIDEKNTDPIVIVNVRINGRSHHSIVIPVPKDRRPEEGMSYKTVKEAASQAIGVYGAKLKEGVGAQKLDITSLNVESPWNEISKDHIAQESKKMPEDAHKFDFDVSVYVDGKLWFHGWEVVGFSGDSVDFATMVAVIQNIIRQMKEGTDIVK
jgi:hypothetical protein